MVVFNNRALGFVELEMKAAGLLEFATDLQNPDFDDGTRHWDVQAAEPGSIRTGSGFVQRRRGL